LHFYYWDLILDFVGKKGARGAGGRCTRDATVYGSNEIKIEGFFSRIQVHMNMVFELSMGTNLHDSQFTHTHMAGEATRLPPKINTKYLQNTGKREQFCRHQPKKVIGIRKAIVQPEVECLHLLSWKINRRLQIDLEFDCEVVIHRRPMRSSPPLKYNLN
jgi:hypothetical protein